MKSACILSFALLAGCTASASDVQPPDTQINFPTGIAVAPDDSVMFVSSANSELQYDSGSVSVVDLAVVDQIASAWVANKTIPSTIGTADGNCSQDPDRTETLICDETGFIRVGAGVRVGNFATDIAIQDRGNGALRLIVPTRGDPSITWIDYDGTKLDCGGGEGFSLCDDSHRLTAIHHDPDIGTLPPEPFDAFADSFNQFAMVTHLTTGAITLIDSPANGDATIADVAIGLFQANTTTGLLGATGIAGRTPNAAGDVVYAGSPTENRIQTVTVARPVNGSPPFILPGNFFFLDAVGLEAGASDDTRNLKFNAAGDRMYLVNREPPTVQVYDTSLGPTGFPNNSLLGATDVCRTVSTLVSLPTDDGDRVFATCFQEGEMYVVDPRGQVNVENIIIVGRGPYGIAVAPTRKKVYVTNFLEDTISVIDESDSPMRDRVVLRIGIPKPPEATQ